MKLRWMPTAVPLPRFESVATAWLDSRETALVGPPHTYTEI